MPPIAGTIGPQSRRPSCRHIALTLLIVSALASTSAGQTDPSDGRHWDPGPDANLRVVEPALPGHAARLAAADTVRVSGTIRSQQTGEGLYGKVVAYDDVTGVVATVKNSAASGAYSVDLVPGAYGFYVRSYGRAPSLYEHVPVVAATTFDPVIDTLASRWPPSYLTSAGADDPVVWVDATDSTTFRLTSTKDLGPLVEVFNEFGSIVADGRPLARIDLHDDGTHGDAVAGDHVYSRAGFGFGGEPVYLGGKVGWDLVVYARVPGGVPPIVAIPPASLLGMRIADAVPVHDLAAGARCSRYAGSVIGATSGWKWDQYAVDAFYRSFADVYDFIYLFAAADMGDFAGMSGIVFNEASGVGIAPYDKRDRFGTRRLLSYLLIRPDYYLPLLHETMHHWGADLDALFDTVRFGWHWGYSGVNGVLGGFDPAKLKDNGDGTYSTGGVAPWGVAEDVVPLADLEMYLAGMTNPLADLPAIPVLINAPATGAATVPADGIRYVSSADIVATYGARVPPASAAQHHFNVAFCWVARQRANDASIAYLDWVARLFAGRASATRVLSFAAATRGVGSVDAEIRPAPQIRRALPRGH